MKDKVSQDDQLPVELVYLRENVEAPSREWTVQTRNRFIAGAKSSGYWTFPRMFGWGAATVTAGTLAVLAIGALLPVSDTSPLHAENAAAAVLLEAASNVDKLPAYGQSQDVSGKYIYIRQHAVWSRMYTPQKDSPSKESTPTVQGDKSVHFYDEVIHEMWRPVDSFDSVRTRTMIIKRVPISPLDELIAAGVDMDVQGQVEEFSGEDTKGPIPVPPPGSESVPPQWKENPFANPTPKTLATLSTNPDELSGQIRTYVRDQYAGDKDRLEERDMFVLMTDVLRSSEAIIPLELRKALFLVMAELPGIEKGTGADLEGRSGVTLKIRGSDAIVLDPKTSQVLGECSPQVKNAHGEDAVLPCSSVSSKIVNAVGDAQ